MPYITVVPIIPHLHTVPMPDLSQHVEVEIPEHVLLDYEIAGAGSRALAAMIDTFWMILIGIVLAGVFSVFAHSVPAVAAIIVVAFFLILTGYPALYEGFRHGQTPGKRRLGIRVVDDTGRGVSFGAAAIRALLRPVDMLGLIGVVIMAIDRRGRRLGDFVAGTLVVRDEPILDAFAAVPAPPAASGSPELDDAEFALVREFVRRADTLPVPVRDRLAARITARLERDAARSPDATASLRQLYDAEAARRQGRFGARSTRAGQHGAGASGPADRLVARQSARWREFLALAQRVDHDGLDALAAWELPDFVTRYREVAADLARARTYGAEPRLVRALTRLVASGHDALYRGAHHTLRRAWEFFADESPAAVVRARGFVAVAIGIFAVTSAAGYAVLRARPELAPQVLPDVMLERADAAAARQSEGLGYVVAAAAQRPFVAASIITNNLQVAVTCFAYGVFAGVGSLAALAYNGLELGAASAYFANRHLLGYLWTFIIGHSVLELFAICVAAAAGFRVGRVLIAPGALPRRDALTLAGREAVRMVSACGVMLGVAGTIEGFLSASGTGIAVRIVAGVAAVLFLVAYLGRGVRELHRARVAT